MRGEFSEEFRWRSKGGAIISRLLFLERVFCFLFFLFLVRLSVCSVCVCVRVCKRGVLHSYPVVECLLSMESWRCNHGLERGLERIAFFPEQPSGYCWPRLRGGGRLDRIRTGPIQSNAISGRFKTASLFRVVRKNAPRGPLRQKIGRRSSFCTRWLPYVVALAARANETAICSQR